MNAAAAFLDRIPASQYDMFAVFEPVPAQIVGPIPPEVQRDFDAEDVARQFRFVGSKADWPSEKIAAWDAQWDRNKREYARACEAEAAGAVEVLGWGAGAPGKDMRFGKAGYTLRLWNDFGRWRTKECLNLFNSGSGGPYHGPFASRAEAMLEAFRHIIRSAATAAARGSTWDDEAKRAGQLAQLARWCIDQAPPLIVGVDLVQEFEDAKRVAVEKETRRRAMFRAVDEVQKAAAVAIYEPGIFTGPDYSGDRSIMDHAEGLEWHNRFVGEYHVTGQGPEGLEIVVYSRDGGRSEPVIDHPLLLRAVERLRAGVAVPVRLASIDEHQLCKSERAKVIW